MKTQFRRLPGLLPAALVLLAVGVGTAHSTMVVRSLSLEETVRESGRVVYARTVDVRSGPDDDGVPATWVTLEVDRTLKGAGSPRIEIKQLGLSGAPQGTLIAQVPDVPQFAVGEEVVVFLRRESARGFTSPVGLEGGVYRVKSEGGRRTARTRNGGAATELDRLLSEIENIVAASP
jgi:hypothetical protein